MKGPKELKCFTEIKSLKDMVTAFCDYLGEKKDSHLRETHLHDSILKHVYKELSEQIRVEITMKNANYDAFENEMSRRKWMEEHCEAKVKALIEECKKELKFKDNRIHALEKEVSRVFDPTKQFWNQEMDKLLDHALKALEEIEDLPPLREKERREISRLAISVIKMKRDCL